jgi:hypothetical protein
MNRMFGLLFPALEGVSSNSSLSSATAGIPRSRVSSSEAAAQACALL